MVKIERTLIPPESLDIEKQKVNGCYNRPDVFEKRSEI